MTEMLLLANYRLCRCSVLTKMLLEQLGCAGIGVAIEKLLVANYRL